MSESRVPPQFRKFHDHMVRRFFSRDARARWHLYRAWRFADAGKIKASLDEFLWLRDHVRGWSSIALRHEALTLLQAAIRSIEKGLP